MKLRNLLNNSCYASIGYVYSLESINSIAAYLECNRDVIKAFPKVILVLNASEDRWFDDAKSTIESLGLNANLTIAYYPKNHGHTFGTMDLDNTIFELAPENSFVWKFSHDTIINSDIFDVDVEEADFYYTNNIGYFAFEQYGSQDNLFKSINSGEYFYPQTNFYILKNTIDYLNDEEEISNAYEKCKEFPNMKPWEVVSGFDCENLLKRCILRNKLSKVNLVDSDNLLKLILAIKHLKLYDGSHKNLEFSKLGNLCHFHNPENPVLVI